MAYNPFRNAGGERWPARAIILGNLLLKTSVLSRHHAVWPVVMRPDDLDTIVHAIGRNPDQDPKIEDTKSVEPNALAVLFEHLATENPPQMRKGIAHDQIDHNPEPGPALCADLERSKCQRLGVGQADADNALVKTPFDQDQCPR